MKTNGAGEPAPNDLVSESITLEDLLDNGQGVGRINGLVAFVTGGLPGERVRIAIDAKKRSYVSAHVVAIEAESPDRVASMCPVFPLCGGCQVLHLRYEAQLAWKRRLVADALTRLGGFHDPDVAPTVSALASHDQGYRNKVSLVPRFIKGAMRLGFYEARSHRVVPIEHCPVLLPRLDEAVRSLVAFANDAPQAFEGIRHVVARASATGPELVVSFNGVKANRALGELVDELRKRMPHVTGLVSNWEPVSDNVLFGERSATLWGTPSLQERIAGATLRFGVASFFQVHSAVLELIAQHVLTALSGAQRVVDLYCGVGTFGVILGKRGIASTGVEWFKPAVDEAVANAAANAVVNAAFETAGASVAVAGERGRSLFEGASAVIVDPPRKGCEAGVLAVIAQWRVPKVLYVSCNPATLARDARLLCEGGYRMLRATPYDMFPHTGHVEAVAEFDLM
ncbi:MAG TPA: 23S rRNA (uracil(1939)-C(5))-methyltransferase RlmD [Candidatus Tumulicola sp.]|nr:23S rRNA (uracil(1939)-C(5))-methyltransferase RlmD [Candidatus Tumulicola sp.]